MNKCRTSLAGLTVTFATRHGKSAALRDILEETHKVIVKELVIDSDALGTFSGEIPRSGSMLDAARAKVELAREAGAEGMILVSEGSFAPHPNLPNVPVNTEILLLADTEMGVEILEEYHTLDTNFDSVVVGSRTEAERFLKFARFGSHGVLVYPEPEGAKVAVEKGITDPRILDDIMTRIAALSSAGTVRLVTDMRAHMNPTRMQALRECGKLLSSRLRAACLSCGSVGFGLVGTETGLPCSDCGTPTGAVLVEVRACSYCGYRVRGARADGKVAADPGQCPECNP